jgi:hypothetical protein
MAIDRELTMTVRIKMLRNGLWDDALLQRNAAKKITVRAAASNNTLQTIPAIDNPGSINRDTRY